MCTCMYSLQVHVHDLQISTHSALYLTVIFNSDILSFKAGTESRFSPDCGKSPSSVGKVPCSVQSVEKLGLMAVGST